MMGEGVLQYSLYLSLKLLPVSPYVFNVATGLITSVPVNDLPFVDNVFFVLGCYQVFLHCVGTFEVSMDPCFAAYVYKFLTEAFGIWDHNEDVVVSVVVPM